MARRSPSGHWPRTVGSDGRHAVHARLIRSMMPADVDQIADLYRHAWATTVAASNRQLASRRRGRSSPTPTGSRSGPASSISTDRSPGSARSRGPRVAPSQPFDRAHPRRLSTRPQRPAVGRSSSSRPKTGQPMYERLGVEDPKHFVQIFEAPGLPIRDSGSIRASGRPRRRTSRRWPCSRPRGDRRRPGRICSGR